MLLVLAVKSNPVSFSQEPSHCIHAGVT